MPPQKTVRLFSALSLPEAWTVVLQRAQEEIARHFPTGIRWTPRGNLHATVRFIGNLPIERAQNLIEFWKTAQLPRELPTLALTSCGCFPSEGPERIIWAGAEPISGSWQTLVHHIDGALSSFGLSLPTEEPVIHITLGRVRSAEAVRGARELLSGMILTAEPLTVKSVELFVSEASDAGSRYVPVASMRHAGEIL